MRLEVDITSKTFKNAAGERHDVIAGVSFALDAGEVGVLVGPSGCGKSTMLRILAGLDHDFQGRVSRPVGARIGFVFQEPRLLPWRSVEQNVRLVAPLADEARLSALFEILELNAHRNHFPGELSLGLARRVLRRLDELARAIHSRSEVAAAAAHANSALIEYRRRNEATMYPLYNAVGIRGNATKGKVA